MAETETFSKTTSASSKRKDVAVTYTELDDFDNVSGRPIHNIPQPAVRAWPTQPKPLVLARKEKVLWTLFDIILIALPVCLIIKIGLCIYAYHLDKTYTGIWIDLASVLSRGLIQLNAQLVTLFTIVFITIMSTFVKRYALWKAQHGACITDLEQLQGSVSLPSTLKLIWSLRSFSVNSMVLALAWSFYYLGSQAVKLEYRLSLSADFGNVHAAIQRSDAPSYFTPNFIEIFNNPLYTIYELPSSQSFLDRLNINLGAMILEDQDSTFALRGTVPNPGTNNGPLIPEYQYAQMLAQSSSSLADQIRYKSGGWLDVSKQSQQKYVSLTGQSLWVDSTYYYDNVLQHNPTASPFLGTYTLHNISYLNVNCSTPVVHPSSAFPNGTLPNTSVSINMSSLSSDALKDRNGYPLRQIEYWHQGLGIDIIPGLNSTDTIPVDYNGTFNYTLRSFQTTCDLSTSYVDMQVRCITTGCYPNRLRWANNTSEYNATSYSTPFDDPTFAEGFLSNFLLSTGAQDSLNATTIVAGEFFPDDRINNTYWSTLGPAQFARVSLFDDTDTSISLTRGFNTYYTLSQAVISAYILPNMTVLLSSPERSDDYFNLVSANGALLEQGYRIYWQWIPVDFVACSILLAAAIGAYWLRINTLAPDIFGYVSSLTRDNPHIHLPTEGSALSGIDRARMLKGVKVKIADVQSENHGESSVGRVGLVPLGAEVRPLYSGARYM